MNGSGGTILTQWTDDANDQVTRLTDDNGNTTDYACEAAGGHVDVA